MVNMLCFRNNGILMELRGTAIGGECMKEHVTRPSGDRNDPNRAEGTRMSLQKREVVQRKSRGGWFDGALFAVQRNAAM